MLIEFSIIAGNDYTKQHTRHLRNLIGLDARRTDIKQTIAWVKKHRRVENNQFLSNKLVNIVYNYAWAFVGDDKNNLHSLVPAQNLSRSR